MNRITLVKNGSSIIQIESAVVPAEGSKIWAENSSGEPEFCTVISIAYEVDKDRRRLDIIVNVE